MEFSYVDEIAPLSEAQWEYIIARYRIRCGREAVRGLLAAKQFHDGIQELLSSAGHTQAHLEAVSQALLDMAESEE